MHKPFSYLQSHCLVYELSPRQPSTVHLAWRIESRTVSPSKENKYGVLLNVAFKCFKDLAPCALLWLAPTQRFFSRKAIVIAIMCQKGPFQVWMLQNENPISHPQTSCILRVMLKKVPVNGNSYIRTYFLSTLLILTSRSISKCTAFLWVTNSNKPSCMWL